MADRQHIIKEGMKINVGVKGGMHGINCNAQLGFEANDQHHAINCDRGAKQFVKIQRAKEKRKRVAQGATAGFFAGGLVGGGAGAGIGAIIGSIIPGPGTLIGAAVGATIGGIVGAGTAGGTGVAVGAGVAAALRSESNEND
jgi:hypothetical protein